MLFFNQRYIYLEQIQKINITRCIHRALLKCHSLQLFALSFIIRNRDMTEGLVGSRRRSLVYSSMRSCRVHRVKLHGFISWVPYPRGEHSHVLQQLRIITRCAQDLPQSAYVEENIATLHRIFRD